MIPRFKPWLGWAELAAALGAPAEAVTRFEADFAHAFEAPAALAFPYGRSALWAFLQAVGLQNAEVLLPAYTCSVVAHAVLLSGNEPRFVDISLRDYNMDLGQMAAALTPRTRAVVATHLFGYPLDVDQLAEIVRAAEARYGHKIWVIQDCAHAFGARWQGRLVSAAGDVGLFGLNISKTITSVFGGMLTVNDPALAEQLRAWRDAHFTAPGALKAWRRRAYLAAVYPAFDERLYGLVYWLQTATPLLNYAARAYHLDEQVRFPPDYAERMLPLEAAVGRVQLGKYAEIVRRRAAAARYYTEALQGVLGWELPPLVEGATYSHYVVRVPDRAAVLRAMARAGVQLGELIEYSVPHLASYTRYAAGAGFPNALQCSQHTVNLPLHLSLAAPGSRRVVQAAHLLANHPHRPAAPPPASARIH